MLRIVHMNRRIGLPFVWALSALLLPHLAFAGPPVQGNVAEATRAEVQPASHSNAMTPVLQAKALEMVDAESPKYSAAEDEKRAQGQPYIDLRRAKSKYQTSSADGQLRFTTMLIGKEREASSNSAHKHYRAKRRALVFTYQLDGDQWKEASPPVWKDVH